MKKAKLEGRIRYVEDWNGMGEHFVFETKWSNEKDWGLDTAFKLIDDKLSYMALTTVRQWQRLGIEYYFA